MTVLLPCVKSYYALKGKGPKETAIKYWVLVQLVCFVIRPLFWLIFSEWQSNQVNAATDRIGTPAPAGLRLIRLHASRVPAHYRPGLRKIPRPDRRAGNLVRGLLEELFEATGSRTVGPHRQAKAGLSPDSSRGAESCQFLRALKSYLIINA
jgi:hypothetical protein